MMKSFDPPPEDLFDKDCPEAPWSFVSLLHVAKILPLHNRGWDSDFASFHTQLF